MGRMFWISPRGEILDFGTTHIQAIIDHPEKFGTTLKKIKDLHAKYGESLGVEGDAREDIIVDATKRGYIRIRFQRNYVSVTVGQWASTAKKLLGQWAKKMSSNKSVDTYQSVKIYQTSNDKMKTYELADLIAGTHMFETVLEDDTPDLVFVGSPNEFMRDRPLRSFKEWYDTEM